MPHGEIVRLTEALEIVQAERNIATALAVHAGTVMAHSGEQPQAFRSWLLTMKQNDRPDPNINRRAIAALNALLPEGK